MLLDIITSLDVSASDTSNNVKGKDVLLRWNDRVEQILIDRQGIHGTGAGVNMQMEDPFSVSGSTSTDVENAAHELQHKLVSLISHHSPALFCGENGNVVKNEIVAMSPLLPKIINDAEGNTTTSCRSRTCFRTDEEANQASLCVSRRLLCRPTQGGDKYVYEDTNINSCGVLELCIQLVRACKNVIRWNRMQLMKNGNAVSKSRKPNVNVNVDGFTSINRLCAVGMVQLYLVFIELNSIGSNCQGGENEEGEETQTQTQMQAHVLHSSMARHATLALFHATFGQSREPCCKKALVAFVDKNQINGIQRIVRLLVKPNATPVLLGLVKIVHNLVGCIPNMMISMDEALSLSSLNSSADIASSGGTGTGTGTSVTTSSTNLFSILVATLAWSLRSQPPFPGDSPTDRRAELTAEILRVLFALRSGGAATKRVEAENPLLMAQLGVILVEILRMPNHDRRCYECKLAVVVLLIDSPVEYGPFLVVNHVIDQILRILWIQLNETVVERAGMVQGERHAATILPVLIVLNELSKAQPIIRQMVKDFIFPKENEDEFATKVQAQLQEERTCIGHGQVTTVSGTSGKKSKSSSKNMHPLDAPQGTTRWKLIKLMTYTESNVKRCSGELLWTLCGKDSQEFVFRCGFGNAVHLLGIKGL